LTIGSGNAGRPPALHFSGLHPLHRVNPMLSQLGKYEIRRELGRGAMGVVYEAYDPMIKRRVALKTIRPDQLAGERPDDVVARFRREAQAAGRLSHPNVVSIYECDEDNGTWFIAMEFVDGRELKEAFAADERFRPADIERIMAQILAALDYSHRQGVVHRDVKPANIFLLRDGTVKVADFGIAHIESSNLTVVGTVVGTPNYMSPEQIMGLPVDGRSDIFSAGVILYQFLTGERPFAGSSTTTMQKVLKEDPLPPSTLNVQLAPVIDAVVRKALAKRADDRFQTAQAFAAALHAAMQVSAAEKMAAAADPDATLPNVATLEAAAPAKPAAAAPPAAAPPPVQAQRPAAPPPAVQSQRSAAPPPPAHSQRTAVAVVAGIAVIGVASLAATWWLWPRADPGATARIVPSAPSVQATAAAAIAASKPAGGVMADNAGSSAAGSLASAAAADSPPAAPGSLVISAIGLADPSDPRYLNDKTLLQTDARTDSKRQLVEKALVMLLDRQSFATNYDVLESRVMSKSGDFINAIVREGEPRIGKDGLMSVATQAVVNVRAVQQSLNQLSRDERVALIRASGDPRVSVSVTVRDADEPGAPPQPSPIAENILKERIKSFGFRTWSDDAAAGGQGADFAVTGEASVKRLATRLAASGLVITKYALSSWTVKSMNRVTGEEIYFNTTLPQGLGSWASEEEALRAIGAKVADQFSRDLFLQHVNVTGRKITLVVTGMPDPASEELLARELLGLPSVLAAHPGPPAKPRLYDLQVGTAQTGSDAIASDVIAPLNAKLGQACFAIGVVDGSRVAITFAQQCADASLHSRLETNPPASLYGAPPARQKAIIKNPDTLRKLV
jgi:serine/threonine-protein kinase